MGSFGTVKPFCAMMLWPNPELSFSQAPLCSVLESSAGWGCSVPLPPTLAPMHFLCSLSHLWRRNNLSIAFCCFWPLHINISKHKVRVPFLDSWWVPHVASNKTHTLHFQLGQVTLAFASPSCGKNIEFSPVHCSSVSSIPRHFSWNFHLCEWQVLYNISRDGTSLTACVFPSVFMAGTCS